MADQTHLFANQAETDREIQIYTERYKLGKHIVVELAQQITNSFMRYERKMLLFSTMLGKKYTKLRY